MDSRFGVKDLIFTLLFVAFIVVVVLQMIQIDRLGQRLLNIEDSLSTQQNELQRVRKTLQAGPAMASLGTSRPAPGGRPGQATSTANASTPDETANGPGQNNPAELDVDDPFYRIRLARKQPDFARGDWFVGSFGSSVGKLTPLISQDASASTVQSHVLQSLAHRDPETLKWRPLIAKRWRISDDGLSITYWLRENARFSDGEPLTAEDVVFTYDWMMNPKVSAPRARAYFKRVEDVKALGQYKVRFLMAEPYFKAFEITAGMNILAEHFYSRFTPEQFNNKPGLLFGSGPYKLAVPPRKWSPGSGKITLVRNDNYWGERPGLDRIVYREILSPTARLTTFRNGGTDLFNPNPEQYVSLKKDQQLLEKAELLEYRTLAGGYRYIGWNQQRNGEPTFFADPKVRRAMTMLIDRRRMTDRLMEGLATIATGPFHRLGRQDDPSLKPWPYDPQRARDLLADAGFKDRDGDGVIESPDGEPFRFKLIFPASSSNYKKMGFFLQDAFKRAGIDMQPTPLEWTMMIQRISSRDFDAMTLGWTSNVETDPYQIFHSSQIKEGGDNYVHYRNPELDQLLEKARRTLDESRRMELWHKVHHILHRDQPYTFLFTQKAVMFLDRRFRNTRVTKLGLNSRDEWYVPQPLQKWGR